MIPGRLSVVTIGARDFPDLRAFYRRLGWQELPSSTIDWAAFLLGGVVLALYPMDQLRDEAAPGEEIPAGQTWNGVTLALALDSADQVDEVFAAAVAAGARPVAEPQQREWGGRSGYIADPEDNRWEIVWAAGARLDERGAVLDF